MNLSIVVTGKVISFEDIEYLQQLKIYYPEVSEIIVVIWKSDIEKFTIFQDPVIRFIKAYELPLERDYNGKIIAIPNQIYSAQVGIMEASGDHILKLRFDLKLKKRLELNFTSAREFQKKIIVGKTIFRCPLDKKSLFFISDLIMAGTKEDLWELWKIDPYTYKNYLINNECEIILNGGSSLKFPLDRLLMFQFISTLKNDNYKKIGINAWRIFIKNNIEILYDDENYINYPKRFILNIYKKNYIEENNLIIMKNDIIKRKIQPYRVFLKIIVIINGIKTYFYKNVKLPN